MDSIWTPYRLHIDSIWSLYGVFSRRSATTNKHEPLLLLTGAYKLRKKIICLGCDHLGDSMENPEQSLEALHMQSMVLHGSSCALHQKLLLYDFVYAIKIALQKTHFGQKYPLW
jgi:hypothetical protein